MFTSIIAIVIGASVVSAAPFAGNGTATRGCGTVLSDEALAAAEADFAANRVSVSSFTDSFTVTLPVYFHVISKNYTIEGGNIPNSMIADQITVLNDAYAGSGITWKLAKIDRTRNSAWFDNVDQRTPEEAEMQRKLRKGGAKALNVYTVGFTNSFGLLGYATYPSEYANEPIRDGAVIVHNSLPGGSFPIYNLGHTLTHEAGHWVGLYHTFQGGCDGVGDEVDDTPPEAFPAFGCPVGRDTCPSEGLDAIHNYMNYSDDDCMTEFTPGQIVRLVDQIATYRGIKI